MFSESSRNITLNCSIAGTLLLYITNLKFFDIVQQWIFLNVVQKPCFRFCSFLRFQWYYYLLSLILRKRLWEALSFRRFWLFVGTDLSIFCTSGLESILGMFLNKDVFLMSNLKFRLLLLSGAPNFFSCFLRSPSISLLCLFKHAFIASIPEEIPQLLFS